MVKTIPKQSFPEFTDPETVLSEDFLNFINDQELDIEVNQLNTFPNNEDLATIFDDFEVNDALHQSTIENFDENLFDNISQEETPSDQGIVINGLDEFLQVPSVISFEVPKRDQTNIPMTVIDHQNYVNFDNFVQSSWPLNFTFPPSSFNNFVPTPLTPTFSEDYSESSVALKKRGRKPNNWRNPNFTKEYVEAARDERDEQKRRNNVSSGQYRKRKAELLEEMEKEIVVEKMKKIELKAKSKKLKKQIKKLRKAVSLYIGAQSFRLI